MTSGKTTDISIFAVRDVDNTSERWRYENDYHTPIHVLHSRIYVFPCGKRNRLAQLFRQTMIRAYYTPGYVFYTEFPGSGFIVECLCYHCGKKNEFVVELFWKQYRKVVFKCSVCNAEAGSARFKGS